MSFIYRAFLYVTRKRTKTLILFLILLVIATLALSGLSIKNATGTAQLNVRQALGGMFSLDQNMNDPSKWVNQEIPGMGVQSYYGGSPLTTDLADKIVGSVKGIKGYNATYTNYLLPKNSKGETLELLADENSDSGMDALFAGQGDFSSTVTAYASTNTKFDSYFAGGYIRLAAGRHLESEDTNGVIISKELAELNGLSVGDKMILQMSEDKAAMVNVNANETQTEVEIIGLFEATSKSSASLSNWSMDNAVYTDMKTVQHARPDMGDESYEHIQFYVDDPAQMDKIIADIKSLSDVDASDFVINVDNSNVDAIMKPLANMDKLITILIVLILAVGAVILYLVLAGRIKERIHESGILLSLGIGKAKIIGQYLIEIAVVAAAALALSVLASQAIAQTVGDQLLDYTLASQDSAEEKKEPAGRDGVVSVGTDDFAPQFEGNNELTKIQVSFNAKVFILMCVITLLIICGSVILAALPVLRLKPREILSKMS